MTSAARQTEKPALSREGIRELATPLTLCFFAAILVVECAVYFSNPGHFFTADTQLWFALRLRSFPEFLASFYQRDPAAWYRPLTNRTIQSLLYPVLGLKPHVYHLLLVPIVFLNSVAVFTLTFVVTRKKLAAGFATIFFALHTVNAYVTYDVAFFVEVIYPLFYMVGVIAAIHYIQSGRRSALWLSLASYAIALLSKESAVTMPATAAVLCWAETAGPWKARARQVLSAVGLHFGLMTIYMIFVIGYLQVGGQALNNVFAKPEPDGNPYHFVFGKQAMENLDFAFTWAFNVPRGWHTSFRNLPRWMNSYLSFFRTLTLFFAALLLLIPRRKRLIAGTRGESGALNEWLTIAPDAKPVLVGLAWFVIALTPMLPLYNHFVPYYIYLPLAGFSILVGASLETAFNAIRRGKFFRILTFTAIIGGLAIVCIHSSRKDMADHPLMGGFATLSGRGLEQVMSRYPRVPPGTTFYFFDDDYGALPSLVGSGLIHLAYADETLVVKHSLEGSTITQEDFDKGNLLVFRPTGSRDLIDITADLKSNPERFISRPPPQ